MRMRHLVVLALAGTIVAGAAPGADAQVDERAEALFARAKAEAARARTLEGDFLLDQGQGGQRTRFNGYFRLLRPNYAQVLFSVGGETTTIQSDGDHLYRSFDGPKQYIREDVDAGGANIDLMPLLSPVSAFFNPSRLDEEQPRRYVGEVEVNGRAFSVVEVTAETQPVQRKFYFGPSGMLEGVEYTDGMGEQGQRLFFRMRELHVDREFRAEMFVFQVPEGFTRFEPPDLNRDLLPVGSKAPDFRLPTAEGPELSLEDTLKGKKAVLINFWFYN